MIGFIALYTFTQLETTGNYSAIADPYTSQFTVAHTRKSSQSLLVVFRQRIHNSLTVTSNRIWKLFLHSLIYLLSFHLYHLLLPSPELDPILDNKSLKRPSLFLYNPSARTMQKTQPLYCKEDLFTDPLPSNGRPIVAGIRFFGNVFTEWLPSTGSIRHNIFHILRSRRTSGGLLWTR
jgi:hypothetical protein